MFTALHITVCFPPAISSVVAQWISTEVSICASSACCVINLTDIQCCCPPQLYRTGIWYTHSLLPKLHTDWSIGILDAFSVHPTELDFCADSYYHRCFSVTPDLLHTDLKAPQKWYFTNSVSVHLYTTNCHLWVVLAGLYSPQRAPSDLPLVHEGLMSKIGHGIAVQVSFQTWYLLHLLCCPRHPEGGSYSLATWCKDNEFMVKYPFTFLHGKCIVVILTNMMIIMFLMIWLRLRDFQNILRHGHFVIIRMVSS